MTNTKQRPVTRDPDFAGAEIAMQRAGKKLRAEARLRGRPLVTVRDGQIVEEIPGPEEHESGADAVGAGG